jgi:hypothetical protein
MVQHPVCNDRNLACQSPDENVGMAGELTCRYRNPCARVRIEVLALLENSPVDTVLEPRVCQSPDENVGIAVGLTC